MTFLVASNNSSQTIVFGGGCFWCLEAVFQMLRGVTAVVSGYTGGKMPNPTYQQVSSEATGHAEVIKVEFDPSIITLDNLLAVFFTSHDPTTPNRQGNDVGTQYRSAIYYTTEAQKTAVESFIKKLTDEKTFDQPVITEVKPLEVFYPAEDYHQNYYRNNSEAPYCRAVINPKIAKLRQQYAPLLK
ncbi:MAG: peptide-methionine (S)-S-oxide reductase MsrA [Candidatus Magasanikbacteria bacterium]|nr:peptide-methionine (S)-S-oxide reductase MsrA [Candidatus Magasanikbacteria bacterium]